MTSNTPHIRKLIAGSVLAAALVLPLGLAQAASELDGATLGKSTDEIKVSLAAQGYEVRKVKHDDGMLKAQARKGDTRYEVYVDTGTGIVSKVDEED
jgi:hypothetical protein